MDTTDSLEKLLKWNWLSISTLIISLLLIIFSFFAPIIFVSEPIFDIDFSDTGVVGDTIGGIMNPFIALAGVLLTFLAFYIQYTANKIQFRQFRLELNEQKLQAKKSQIENQFYEMYRMHKENVNDIQIILTNKQGLNETQINGRRVFEYIVKEFELSFLLMKAFSAEKNVRDIVRVAYVLFFHGLDNFSDENLSCIKTLKSLKLNHMINQITNFNLIISKTINKEWKSDLNFTIFEGYSSQLAHYYRHLFQTVKFIANQPDDLLSYEEKRKYLRILRAQLTNQEQVMLFYNWLSKFGTQWENETNKFFTDYRMIHNIYNGILISDIKIEDFFDLEGSFKKEINRELDPLFESADWE